MYQQVQPVLLTQYSAVQAQFAVMSLLYWS